MIDVGIVTFIIAVLCSKKLFEKKYLHIIHERCIIMHMKMNNVYFYTFILRKALHPD